MCDDNAAAGAAVAPKSSTDVTVGFVETDGLLRSMLADAISREEGLSLAFAVANLVDMRQGENRRTVGILVLGGGLTAAEKRRFAMATREIDPSTVVVALGGRETIALAEWTKRSYGRRWIALPSQSIVSSRIFLDLLHRIATQSGQDDENRTGTSLIATQLAALSPQQLAVLRLTAEGFSNTATAMRLGVSRRTVENHLLTIYRVLGISSDELNSRVVAVLRYLAEIRS